MPELRKDMVRDNWVIIVIDRVLKPNDFPINKQGMHTTEINGFCPFCEGNESCTPPEITAYRKPGLEANSTGWSVRIVPNKFSAFELDGILQGKHSGIYSSYNGLGQHEVVIETPDHCADFNELPPERIETIITMIKDRYNELAKDPRIKYIKIYKNRGLFAGASLGHSHSQIVGIPLVPEVTRGIVQYYNDTGHCLICDMMEQELKYGVRVVYETDLFLLICPYASRYSYEAWIIPKKHMNHFGDITSEQAQELSVITKEYISTMLSSLDNPSYNLLVNSAPVNVDGDLNGYHWFIEITPRLTVTAGLEIGTGYYVNPVSPELAAGILRDSLLKK